MYLSRIKLDLNKSATRKAISSPQILHGMVENCFTEKNRTLWRLDSLNGTLYLLIISKTTPNFEDLALQICKNGERGETKDYTTFMDIIKNGQGFRFRFRGNPVHSVVVEKGIRGKVTPHVGERHKREWFAKKAIQNGFTVDDDQFSIVETGVQQFYKKDKGTPVRLSYTVFEGILVVKDKDLFVKALTQGIGRAKAYGCGLITIMGLE
jgi:CRISPR system Cascade subunit CasE